MVEEVTICLSIVFLMLSLISGHAAVELVALNLCMRLVALAMAWVIDSFLALMKLSTAALQSSKLGALSYIFARLSTMVLRLAPDATKRLKSSSDSPYKIMLRMS